MKKRLLSLLFTAQVMFTNIVNIPASIDSYSKQVGYLNNKETFTKKTEESMKKLEDEVINAFKTNDFYKDEDAVLLARMLLGETAGCSKLERIKIAGSAFIRAGDYKKWNGKTLKEAILYQEQYSCFNKGTDSSKFLKTHWLIIWKSFLIACI
jgi:hypothetical protein